MSSPRILHLVSGKMYGGVETMLHTLAAHRGNDPRIEHRFAVCFEGRLSQELAASGCRPAFLGEVRCSKPWTVLAAREELEKQIVAAGIDICVCHLPWSLAVFGPAVRRAGAKLVFWGHGTKGNGWLDLWASWISPDLLICNSTATSRSLMSMFRNVASQTLFYPVTGPPSATAQERNATRAELEVQSGQVVILQVSRMERWKGHTLHLEALAKLRDLPHWTVWFAGGAQNREEAEYQRALERQARELQIDERVRFLGMRSDVPRLMAAADIFCQPNLEPEPFGIVFVEALYAGLPVVGVATGGVAEIGTPKCGILVPRPDVGLIAAALCRLVLQPQLRIEMGAAGASRASALCHPARQVQRLGNLLRAVSCPPPAVRPATIPLPESKR